MSAHIGDFVVGQTIRHYFNTTDPTTRAPVTLAGSPVVSVYRDGGGTEFTSGVTLSVDFDSRTGLHMVVIDTSASAANYPAGGNFVAALTAGTVGGVSVVGAVLFTFSLQRLAPGVLAQGILVAGTVSSITLQGSTAPGLIANQCGILITTGAGAGQFKTLSAVNSGTGVCTPATNFSIAPGTANYVIFPLAEASSDISSITTQLNALQADLDDVQSRLPTALVGGAINANVSGLQANVVTNAAIASGAIDANKVADGFITAPKIADGAIDAATFATGAINAAAVATDAVNEIADGLIGRNIAGGSSGGRTIGQALMFLRNRVVIDASTVTVYATDDTTVAWTGTVTRTGGLNALAAIDPA